MVRLTKISRAVIAGAAVLALAGPAAAEEGNKFEWSVNAAGTSDYMYRGISQRDNDPAFSAGADISYGMFYAGIWGSMVDPDFVTTNTEIDGYFGVKPEWGKFTFDFGVLYYGYPNQDSDVNVDYWEFKAAVTAAATDNLSVGVGYWYTPDYSFETGVGHNIEANASYSLPKFWVFDPSISGAVGYNWIEDEGAFPLDRDTGAVDEFGDPLTLSNEITYWHAGLALTVEAITFDFRYWDSSLDNALSDGRFVFTTKLALP